ncbi:MAG TPA: glycoside hydrolase family 9 protein [Terriglobia bacterium]|nr:glycoside hydrolase family 9 protein [Terriglobia bacterium]
MGNRKLILLACCLGLFARVCLGRVRVLVDQVGYQTQAPKRAIIEGTADDHPQEFTLVDASSGAVVLRGKLAPDGQVYNWRGRVFWTADFSSWRKTGHYEVRTRTNTGVVNSCPFAIQDNVLERNTISNVIYYFKGQRSSGLLDRADRHLAVPCHPGQYVDVHGGWYDATGDYGIHFSQLNLTSYFNTQQVPLVVWSLLASYNELKARGDFNFSEYVLVTKFFIRSQPFRAATLPLDTVTGGFAEQPAGCAGQPHRYIGRSTDVIN